MHWPQILFQIGAFFFLAAAWGGTGALDASYHPGPDSYVRSLSEDAEGRILVGGHFTEIGGFSRHGLARLKENGEVDDSFVPELNGPVDTFAVLANGKVLVAVGEAGFGMTHKLVRLNPDGSNDPTMSNGEGHIQKLMVLPNGAILLIGSYADPEGGKFERFGRLTPEGLVEPDFVTPFLRSERDWIGDITLQSDGKILATGRFTREDASRPGWIRLHSDGNLDGTFLPPQFELFKAEVIAVQADGRVLISGVFYPEEENRSLIRLHPDGEFDPTFKAPYKPDAVWDLLVDKKGRIVVAGSDLSRWNPDGSRDWTLNPFLSGAVFSVIEQRDGRLLIGGPFSAVDGLAFPYLARLNEESIPSAFHFTHSPAVSEGMTELNFIIERRGLADFAASVEYETSSNSARPGVDYLEQSGTLIYQPGERTKTVQVPIFDDDVYEEPGFKSIIMTLKNPSVETALGIPSMVEGRVWENDHLIELTAAEYTVHELDGIIKIWVERKGPLTFPGAIEVDYQVLEETATAGEDFISKSGTLRFSGIFLYVPENRLPIEIEILDDVLLEGNEVFVVKLSEPRSVSFPVPQNVSLGRRSSARVTILDNETTSSPGLGADGVLRAAVLHADGKIDILGEFSHVNGIQRPGLARLNPDLTLDFHFDPGNGPEDGRIRTIAAFPNGQLMVGGDFSRFRGVAQSGIVRLHADGSVDHSFQPGPILPEGSGAVASIQPVSHGRFIVVGNFTGFGNVKRSTWVLMEPDGSIDLSFLPPLTLEPAALATQPDGKLVVSSYEETGWGLVRLNPDGSLDPEFNVSKEHASFAKNLLTVPTGEVIAWEHNGVIRLNPDGSRQLSVAWPELTGFHTVARLNNEQLLFYSIYDGIRRLHPDGTIDPRYHVKVNDLVTVILPLPDGRIFIGGAFTKIDGLPSFRFALLDQNGKHAGAVELFYQRQGPNSRISIRTQEPLPIAAVLLQSTDLIQWLPVFTNAPGTVLDFPTTGTEEKEFFRLISTPAVQQNP
jgi:uncharacterized delta-60 repeat protein